MVILIGSNSSLCAGAVQIWPKTPTAEYPLWNCWIGRLVHHGSCN